MDLIDAETPLPFKIEYGLTGENIDVSEARYMWSSWAKRIREFDQTEGLQGFKKQIKTIDDVLSYFVSPTIGIPFQNIRVIDSESESGESAESGTTGKDSFSTNNFLNKNRQQVTSAVTGGLTGNTPISQFPVRSPTDKCVLRIFIQEDVFHSLDRSFEEHDVRSETHESPIIDVQNASERLLNIEIVTKKALSVCRDACWQLVHPSMESMEATGHQSDHQNVHPSDKGIDREWSASDQPVAIVEGAYYRNIFDGLLSWLPSYLPCLQWWCDRFLETVLGVFDDGGVTDPLRRKAILEMLPSCNNHLACDFLGVILVIRVYLMLFKAGTKFAINADRRKIGTNAEDRNNEYSFSDSSPMQKMILNRFAIDHTSRDDLWLMIWNYGLIFPDAPFEIDLLLLNMALSGLAPVVDSCVEIMINGIRQKSTHDCCSENYLRMSTEPVTGDVNDGIGSGMMSRGPFTGHTLMHRLCGNRRQAGGSNEFPTLDTKRIPVKVNELPLQIVLYFDTSSRHDWSRDFNIGKIPREVLQAIEKNLALRYQKRVEKYLSLVEYFYDHPRVEVDKLNHDGYTPLLVAMQEGEFKIVITLLRRNLGRNLGMVAEINSLCLPNPSDSCLEESDQECCDHPVNQPAYHLLIEDGHSKQRSPIRTDGENQDRDNNVVNKKGTKPTSKPLLDNDFDAFNGPFETPRTVLDLHHSDSCKKASTTKAIANESISNKVIDTSRPTREGRIDVTRNFQWDSEKFWTKNWTCLTWFQARKFDSIKRLGKLEEEQGESSKYTGTSDTDFEYMKRREEHTQLLAEIADIREIIDLLELHESVESVLKPVPKTMMKKPFPK